MADFWVTIVSSSVIAAVISGIVTIIISRLQHKDALDLNRHNRKCDLSIEAFENLIAALTQINHSEEPPHNDNASDDIMPAFIIMFSRSKKKMEVTKATLDQISYLLPRKKVAHLIEEHIELEKNIQFY